MNNSNWLSKLSVHIFAWLMLLLLPLLMFPIPFDSLEPGYHERILTILVNGFFLIIVFYTNYYYFIPKLFFRKRYLLYSLSIIACILLIFLGSYIYMPPKMIQPGNLMQKPGSEMIPQLKQQLNSQIMPQMKPQFMPMMAFAVSKALMMYIVVFFSSIYLRVNSQLKKTEKEKLAAELSYLKTQVNPHFLFNTLNSIYAVTLEKSPQGADMIQQLSEMMRYSLVESQKDRVPLDKELTFIGNYIKLQAVRLNELSKINYIAPEKCPDKQICPLLLIPFVENAFKHGVHPEHPGNIEISIDLNSDNLILLVNNTIHQGIGNSGEKSGIGIENTKKRLALLYPNKHVLNIIQDETRFMVQLTISLS